MWYRILFLAGCTFSLMAAPSNVFGQSTGEDIWKSRMSQPLPFFGATPASGPWADEFPFNPATFGKVRGHVPLKSTGLIIIFTRTLDEPLFKLAHSIDAIVAESNKTDAKPLRGSYIHKFDKVGAQYGGYTANEVVARIDQVKSLAEEFHLANLSIGIAANSDYKSAGLIDPFVMAIVYATQPTAPKTTKTVAWYRMLDPDQLTTESIDETMTALKQAVQSDAPTK